MKILYQIPGELQQGDKGLGEARRRQKLLNQWAEGEATVLVRDTCGGPSSVESQIEEALCVPPMLQSLVEGERDFDALIIGCFGDPGLAVVREAMDCPVIGPLESSFHLGCQLGQRVGIVTVLERLIPLLDRLALSMGQHVSYAGTTAVEIPVLSLAAQREELVGRLAQAALPLIEGKGADVLVLGCMSLSFLDVCDPLGEELGLPVVNPAQCSLETARSLLAQGLMHSRRCYPAWGRKQKQFLQRFGRGDTRQ